ncbi:hypothetical protein ILUMI_01126, partial [Ignelater luminosus]
LPVISPFQFDGPSNAGDTAQLFCHVTKGDRPLKIKWYHNGKHISHHSFGISTAAFGTHTSILSISSVEPIHSGDYTCVASNVAGKTQYTATLDVFVAPQIVPFDFGEDEINTGDMTSLQCTVSKGDFPIKILWTHNGSPVNIIESISTSKVNKRISTLSIDAVEAHHVGNYTCIAENSAGIASHSAFLNVNVLPQIAPFDFSHGEESINSGETVAAQCIILKGDSPLNFTWSLNGKNINPNNGITIMTVKRFSTLSIDSVEAHHAGNYTCFSSNLAGTVSYSTSLNVNVLPQIAPFEFSHGEEFVNSGETVTAQCTILKGDSPLIFTWTLNGNTIGQNDGITITTFKRFSILGIDSVQAKHTGEYECTAKNDAGTSSHSTYLNVKVAPQIFPFTFGEDDINAGDTISVQCTISKGDNPLNISWTLNGNEIKHLRGITLLNSKRVSYLTIESVQAEHSGEYSCVAANMAGTAKYSAYLNVNVKLTCFPSTLVCIFPSVPPHILPFNFEDESVNEGDGISAQCTVTKGDYPLNITWTLNGELIKGNEGGISIMRASKRSSTLTIDYVTYNHIGNYTCIASNKAGSIIFSAALAVNVVPQIMPFDFGEETMNAGDTVSAQCTITKGDLPMKINWYLNGKPVNVQEGIFTSYVGKRVSTLAIDSVRAEHSGEYTCSATNSAGSTNFTAYLNVNVLPQILPFNFGEEVINSGDMATVQCAVIKGDFPIEFLWQHNSQYIDPSSGITITQLNKRISTLSIDSVDATHRGNYSLIPEIIPFEFAKESVNAGDTISAQCTVTKGDLPISIQWFLNDKLVSEKNGILTGYLGKKINNLAIDSVQAEHSGEYTCSATNSAGSTNFTTYLHVNVVPQIIPFDFGEESVNAGDTISAHCTVTKGDLPISIQWYLNGRSVSEKDGILTGYLGKKINSLAIDSVQAEHNVVPQIMPFDFGEEIINAGDTVSAQCTVTKGDLPVTIQWYLNSKLITEQDGILTGYLGKKINNLAIDSVQAEHSGEYTCSATNSAGSTNFTTYLNVNVLPQILPFDFGDEVINSGDMATVQCAVTKGDFPIEFLWQHNLQNIEPSSGISITQTNKRISTLSIDSVEAIHRGNYSCTVRNFAGTTSYSAELNINVPPQISPFDFGENSINEGDGVSAHCTVAKGDYPLNITWTLNEKRINKNEGITVTRASKRLSTVSIDYVTHNHIGNYTCIASNKAGSVMYTAALAVNVAPQLIPFDFGEESMNAGDAASVQCTVTKGDLPVKLVWFLNGQLIDKYDGIVTSRLSKRVSSLTIDSIQAEHAGEYTCSATNRAGSANFTTLLNVNVLPQILPFDFGEEPINTGDMATVNCAVTKGDFPIKIFWTLNGKPIRDIQGITRGQMNKRISTLSIDSVEGYHAGNYTCTAKNLAGISSYSAYLNVNVPPQILPFDFGEETINSGDVIVATCVVTKGDFPIAISWTLNGQHVKNIGGIRVVSTSKRVSQLSIESVQAEHAGMYVFAPQIIPFDFGEESMNAGDTASLQCTIMKGDLPMKIMWFLNGKLINKLDGIVTNRLSKRVSSLTIDSIQAEHAGEYTCRAANRAGSTNFTTYLNVNVLPQILPFDFGEDPINTGDMATVQCAVTKGDFPIKIYWTLNGKPMKDIQGVTTGQMNKRISTLSIESVEGHHAGNYVCTAKNSAGIAWFSADLNINVPPQILPFDFGEETVNSGDVIVVNCVVTKGDFPYIISWTLNEHPVKDISGITVVSTNKRVSQLSIESVQAEHTGMYICNAQNSAGSTNHSAYLHVNVPPQILPFDFGEETVNSGDVIIATCGVTKGDFPITISWTLNERPVKDINGITVASTNKRVSQLSIESVQAEHTGMYIFVPQILPFDFGEEPVNSGDLASLTCSINKGDLPIKILWLHNNENIKNDEGILINQINRKISTLSIDSVEAKHAGEYTCVAKNLAGTAIHSASLNVNVLPQILPFDFGDEPINSGDMVSLSCSINKGDLPLDIFFSLNGQILDSSNGIVIAKVNKRLSTLSIEYVQAEHVGEYTCTAKNPAGISSYSAFLHVNVPPQILPFEFGENALNADDMASVICTINKGDFPLNISWSLNGKSITNIDGISILKTNKRISQLSIESIQAKHAGEYICIAANAAGTTTHTAHLHINVLPYIAPFDFEGEVNTGDSVQLNCYVSKGDLPVSITWTLNGKPITLHSGISMMPIGGRTSLLTISSVEADHAGDFDCTASNKAGSSNHMATLFINGTNALKLLPPQILPFDFGDVTLNTEDMVSVMCTVNKGDFPLNITWALNGKPIATINGITVLKTNKRISQLILPYITPFDFEGEANTGDSVQLTCYVSRGDLPVSISWALNNKQISLHSGISIIPIGGRTSLLTITSVEADHAGEF